MPDLLLDTDIFIDHLRGAHEIRIDPGTRGFYSSITRCELFASNIDAEDVLQRLLGPFVEVPVDSALAEVAGRIRRTARVRTPDALIAATAISLGAELVTRNLRDFSGISGLRVLER